MKSVYIYFYGNQLPVKFESEDFDADAFMESDWSALHQKDKSIVYINVKNVNCFEIEEEEEVNEFYERQQSDSDK